MNAEYGVSGTFSAMHDGCGLGRLHGHSYRVQAFVTGEPDIVTLLPIGADGLQSQLHTRLAMLHHQELHKVMPGASTSVTGLAASIMGDLVAHYPRLTEVVVTDEADSIGRMRRTPRVL